MATAHAVKFAPNPARRALIAKVQIARKEIGLIEDDYRRILVDVTGHASLTELTEAQLVRVIERFKQRGWKPKVAAGKAPKARPADHPMAKKARALWISLYQLGAIKNPSEQAFEAFAHRRLGVDRLQWADQAMGYKLIEALKTIGTRHGWDQDVSGVPKDSRIKALRIRLCEAILAKLKRLGRASRHWSVEEAAWYLCGLDRGLGAAIWDSSHLDLVAAGLGATLRIARGQAADGQ